MCERSQERSGVPKRYTVFSVMASIEDDDALVLIGLAIILKKKKVNTTGTGLPDLHFTGLHTGFTFRSFYNACQLFFDDFYFDFNLFMLTFYLFMQSLYIKIISK